MAAAQKYVLEAEGEVPRNVAFVLVTTLSESCPLAECLKEAGLHESGPKLTKRMTMANICTVYQQMRDLFPAD